MSLVDARPASTTPASKDSGVARFVSIGALLTVVLLGGLVATVVWSGDRGLDITDEGYYLHLYAQPEVTPGDAGLTQFYVLVDLLSGPFEPGVATYRILGVLLLIGAAALLGEGVYRFASVHLPRLSQALPHRALGLSFVAIAGLLGFAWTPLTPGYNQIAAGLVALIAGSLLVALATGSNAQRFGYGALAGALLPSVFYTKWPAAVGLAVVVAILALIVVGSRAAVRLVGLIYGTAALTFAVVTEELAGGWFSLDALLSSTRAAASSGYEPPALVFDAVVGLIAGLAEPFYLNPVRLIGLVLLFAGGSIARMLPGIRDSALIAWVLRSAGALYLVAEIPFASYIVDRFDHFTFVAAIPVALLIAALLAYYARSRRLPDLSLRGMSREAVLALSLLAFLVALTLLTTIGSNTHILTGALIGAAPLGAAVIVSLAWITVGDPDARVAYWNLAVPVVAVVLAAQVFNGVVVDPYRLGTARTAQDVPIPELVVDAGVRVDAEFAASLEELRRVVDSTSYEPGDHVLVVGWIPGLAYLLGGVTPGTAWISPDRYRDQTSSCRPLEADAERVAATSLLLIHGDLSPGFDRCLRELIAGYPEGFTEAGAVDLVLEFNQGVFSDRRLSVLELSG